MKISLEWLSDFVDLPAGTSPDELAHQLTLKTVEVENTLQADGDVVFEIDNKSLTNRPDLWGHYGIAREFAAIYGLPLRPLPTAVRPAMVEDLVESMNAAVCARFAAVRFAADASTTPEWMRRRLSRIGEGSVHPLVDLSNYVMFTVGQPTHVYDADRVRLPLAVDDAADGTQVEVLNGQPVILTADVPMVRDARGVVAVAGVIGGATSSVHPGSRQYVLEAATFRRQVIRRASQRLGIRTDASARYEKGLDTQRVDAALDLFLHLLPQVTSGLDVAGMQDVLLEPTPRADITLDRQFLLNRIGEDLGDDTVQRTLHALGFEVDPVDGGFDIVAPTWRSTGDVSMPHDIVEEVARIYGYDNLTVADIPITLRPSPSLHRRPLDRTIREQLALRGGLQEVITYPWTTDQLLGAVGYDKDQTVRFEGATAPDRDALRPALLPNLLDAAAANLRYFPSFGIFEVGTVFRPTGSPASESGGERLPEQPLMLAIVLVGDDGKSLFRRAQSLLAMVRRHCHIVDLTVAGETDAAWADQSARVGVRAGDRQVGTLALLAPRVLRVAGIDGVQVAYTEIDLRHLRAHTSRDNRFEPLSEFPETDFDLSVVVPDEVPWEHVERTVSGLDKLIRSVTHVDDFRGSWVPAGHRSLTLRVVLRPTDGTLTADMIETVRSRVLSTLAQELGAHMR